ncbi:MAG: tryptophan synthase subunit alpha, partial [Actinobacteria bacterium]|nr:tryptophan synthase subunit alpha [Actinomycetota bacterium]
VCSITTGFVYAASLMGVTGVASVSAAAPLLVERTRPSAGVPIAVGLGVSTAAQAHDIAAYADGVIVGSAFVRLLLDAASASEGVAAVGRLAADLARGVRRT